ncbi:MAG: PD-(D/E)XK nuclease family protein, partial [Calditrichia bacterium]|nr:PD-(D/E)XK nuclease family protein [Calditrichia bacterium]
PMNMMLFQKWLSLGNKVKFFAPLRNSNGDFLQLSTFLEYLEVTEQFNLKPIMLSFKTTKEHFEQFYGKLIRNPENNPRLIRHNDYLNSGKPQSQSPFLGYTGPQQNNTLKISSYRMDDLLKCPMRYWFSSVLSLKETDADPAAEERMIMGNIIHNALEEFGKEKGFTINKQNLLQSCKLLSEKIEYFLQHYKTDIKHDLFTSFKFNNYFEGLAEGTETNLMVKILKWNRDEWEKFNPLYFEKEFKDEGDEEATEKWKPVTITNGSINITFRGVIDKILKSNNDNIVIGTDYKTGNISSQKDIVELWSSQLLIYYLVLKHYFPEKQVVLAYEQLKSLKAKEHGISYYLGDTENESWNLRDKQYRNKNILISRENEEGKNVISLEQIIEQFFKAAQKAIDGNFHLTDRDIKKACEYCSYEKICRRDCV